MARLMGDAATNITRTYDFNSLQTEIHQQTSDQKKKGVRERNKKKEKNK